MKLSLGIFLPLLGLTLFWGLAACDNLPAYLAKQGLKQGALLLKAENIDEVLKRPDLDAKTESYLRLAKHVLTYADERLGMRVGRNYQKYIAMDRTWVTQIVTAAYPDRLEPYLFKYPIMGALPYKGFFDEEDAAALEKNLQSAGFDTYRRKVEAYSTAGWLPDPVLSTMFSSSGRLIELLFHELTHATFYFAGQADFNEAFASWMGFRGALEFLEASKTQIEGAEQLKGELEQDHQRQLKLARIVKEILEEGRSIYAGPGTLPEKRKSYFEKIRARFAAEKGFEKWEKAPWNNALVLSLGTYYAWVEPIEQYARTHQLSPRQFLALVTQKGPAFSHEILGQNPRNLALRSEGAAPNQKTP